MRATDEIALVNVIWPDAHHDQLVQQFFHHHGIIVDAAQQDGLIAQRDAGVSQTRTGGPDFSRRFTRVVGVDIDPQRVKLLEHCAQ